MSQVTETLKRKAVVAVLARLGGDNLTMLKQNLRADYKIDLERDGGYILFTMRTTLHSLTTYKTTIIVLNKLMKYLM